MTVAIIGIDLAKRRFQLHGADEGGRTVFSRRMDRRNLAEFLAQLNPTIIAMEACATANHWGRYCQSHGHEVRLVPTQYARAYVKTNKNDAADAQAIAEAASRRHIRWVPVKSEEQQSIQALHRVRERLKRDRTALANEIRGILAEYGLVFAKQLNNLRRGLRELQCQSEEQPLPPLIHGLLQELHDDLAYLDRRIDRIEVQIKQLNQQSAACRRLLTIPGIGELNASAFAAAIGSGVQFKTGRDLAAWLGLVPRQQSSGSRERLLGISKRGDSYLRRILIHGARAFVCRVAQRGHARNQLEAWILQSLSVKHVNAVCVAVANKLARIVWAVLRHETEFYSPPYQTV